MKKILLGMSGGVDSTVSAILLKKAGYEVIGITLNLFPNSSCCSYIEVKDICKKIGIPHYILEAKEEFKKRVIDDFICCYSNCLTPNPCIECNKYLKFGLMFEKAKELGCEYIATGHYAKIEESKKYGQLVLKKADAEKKDQTYFLYTIPQELLKHIIFPLQNYTSKEDTRKIAKENKLTVAEKKDSQEICFIPNNSYQDFLKKHMEIEPEQGNIVLTTGKILGKHKGLINYTIGQRKGLGISYKEPLYVVKLDNKQNEVIVGTEKDLYRNELNAKDINWIIPVEKTEKQGKIECYAKIRYRAKQAKATIHIQKDNTVKVEFEEPQRAITAGQAVVFYDEEGIVLGGGKII